MFGAATIENLDEPLARALQNERRPQERHVEQVLAMCAEFPGTTQL
jgi:hypothetical protein